MTDCKGSSHECEQKRIDLQDLIYRLQSHISWLADFGRDLPMRDDLEMAVTYLEEIQREQTAAEKRAQEAYDTGLEDGLKEAARVVAGTIWKERDNV